MASEYTPTDEEVRTDYVMTYADRDSSQLLAGMAFDQWLSAHDARVRAEAAREALDGLSEWLGELAEKHPSRSAHVPLMQGHITRYTTDHYPKEADQ